MRPVSFSALGQEVLLPVRKMCNIEMVLYSRQPVTWVFWPFLPVNKLQISDGRSLSLSNLEIPPPPPPPPPIFEIMFKIKTGPMSKTGNCCQGPTSFTNVFFCSLFMTSRFTGRLVNFSFNSSRLGDARPPSMIQIMAFRLFGDQQLSEPML